jgi:hypothetical protein
MGGFFQHFQKNNRSSVNPDTEEVKAYVKASSVMAQKGTKCVDGRYLPNQAHGMLARPGADGGYVMALEAVNRNKGLGLTPLECFNAVFKAIKKLNGTFYLHTDEHASAHNGLIGCGHIAKAGRKMFSWEYDIRSGDVKDMVHYARNLLEISPNIEMVNLMGKHEEKGVLIIHGAKYTVLADNPKRHQMYFIYDVDRDRVFMRKLVEEMNIKGVTYDDMIKEADLQLDATLQNLAVGLPIYKVEFDGSSPKVTFVSNVTPKTFLQRIHMPPHSYFASSRH